MKRLVISIDPGFDAAKIVINKRQYKYPFAVEDITEELDKFPLQRTDNSFVLCKMDGRTYLVGEYARRSLLETEHLEEAKVDMDNFYTTGRFKTNLFKVGFFAFMGMALYDYAQETKDISIDDINNCELFVGVALPHEFCDILWKTCIKDLLAEDHKFILDIGNNKNIKFDLILKENNCVYNSQAICALIDMVCNDDGNMIEKDKTIMDYLPAIVIDAGYKTLGKFKLSRDGRMDKAESNTLFAMNNINEQVSAKIREKVPNIYPYMIEDLYKNNESVYYEEDGEVKYFNIKKMRDEITKQKAIQLMEYLRRQHNNLLDVKLILLAGGTGAAYFDTINEYCSKRINLKDKVWLAKSGFDGAECDPVFAISIGLYKAMALHFDF